MKNLLLNAALAAVALGALPSCSVLAPLFSAENRSGNHTTPSKPRLMSKAEAERASGTRSSWLSALWASPGGAREQKDAFLPGEVDLSVKVAATGLPMDKHGRPTYFDENVRHRYVRTTSYSHQENEVGAFGRLNAMGTVLKYGRVRSAAADWSRYPVGTVFRVKGLPHVYVVDDYGSALVGTNTIDIYHPTLQLMRKWATRDAEIHVVRWGSWEQSANLLRGRTRFEHCARMYHASIAKIRSRRVALGEESRRNRPSL